MRTHRCGLRGYTPLGRHRGVRRARDGARRGPRLRRPLMGARRARLRDGVRSRRRSRAGTAMRRSRTCYRRRWSCQGAAGSGPHEEARVRRRDRGQWPLNLVVPQPARVDGEVVVVPRGYYCNYF
jgi:hypothetical protein